MFSIKDIILRKIQKYCLHIREWIRMNCERENEVCMTKLTDANFIGRLYQWISFDGTFDEMSCGPQFAGFNWGEVWKWNKRIVINFLKESMQIGHNLSTRRKINPLLLSNEYWRQSSAWNRFLKTYFCAWLRHNATLI